MDLFDNIDNFTNILPKDGVVQYFGPIFSFKDAQYYYNTLLKEIDWKPDQALIFGKMIETKRKVAWYGNLPFLYTYSKITKKALPWTETLLQLKKIAEEKTNETYNSCLLNLYHDGSEGMAWHSDGEKQLKHHGAIASMSLGAERKFGFKHKITKETVYLQLANGSLLVMKGSTQAHWVHQLPASKKIKELRVNLTFRTIV